MKQTNTTVTVPAPSDLKPSDSPQWRAFFRICREIASARAAQAEQKKAA